MQNTLQLGRSGEDPGAGAATPAWTYHAFISYAHEDARVARWLHRSLETFRLPSGARPTDAALAYDVVQPFYPCFLDREELRGGALPDQITTALHKSRNLIVLCSVHSRDSDWVDREVAEFLSVHPATRVFPVLTGETDGLQEVELFPKSLRAGLQISKGDIGTLSLLATDLRPTGDGARRGLFKIIAGTSGILFRDLIARQAKRERNTRLIWATGILAAVLAAVQITSTSLESTGTAELFRRVGIAQEQMRLGNEGAVTFMMGSIEEAIPALLGSPLRCDIGIGACGYFDEEFGPVGQRLLAGGPDDLQHDETIWEAVALTLARVEDAIEDDRKFETWRSDNPLNLPGGPSTYTVHREIPHNFATGSGERFYSLIFSLPQRDGFIRYAWVIAWKGAIPDLVRAEALRVWGRAIPVSIFLVYALAESRIPRSRSPSYTPFGLLHSRYAARIAAARRSLLA